MTDSELDELLGDCPTLYHVAAQGSWASIERHGLLSTSALLDRWGVANRRTIEAERRAEGIVLDDPQQGRATLRDQKPMDDAGLRRCLTGGLAPADWYRLLNARVFFWMTKARLHRLLNARPYRGQTHDVLELDTAAVIAAHRGRVALSAINSGATKPFGAPRGPQTFLPIEAYPYDYWRSRRKPGERVVEFTILGGLPDAKRFVRRVTAMTVVETTGTIYQASQAAVVL